MICARQACIPSILRAVVSVYAPHSQYALPALKLKCNDGMFSGR